jgi:hypothetical protein
VIALPTSSYCNPSKTNEYVSGLPDKLVVIVGILIDFTYYIYNKQDTR